jgi:cobalt-zinc-cadmium efflux system protein
MPDECLHGQQHYHHHHHHFGVAEGVPRQYVKKLQIAVVLAFIYFAAQLLGGALSGSLALFADAGHKLADILSISLALVAAWFAHLSASPRKTFGFYRLEILAALTNGAALFMVALTILWEAYDRSRVGQNVHVEGGLMLLVAGFGLFLNLISAAVLYPAKDLNLNVKGALFHIMTDILDSVGTMLAALGILLFHVMWLDTLISAIIASLVLYNATRVFWEAFNILMESAPRQLSVSAIKAFIQSRVGVLDVHDLHIWTITTGKEALLAHVRVTEEAFQHETARNLEKDLREHFDLCHITVQLEPPGFEEEALLF